MQNSEPEVISWDQVNALVKPEYQYRDLENPPLDNIRMAWPFKTEEELRILSEWYKKENERMRIKLSKQAKELKRQEEDKHVKRFGKALL